jgi:hypothetical protein
VTAPEQGKGRVVAVLGTLVVGLAVLVAVLLLSDDDGDDGDDETTTTEEPTTTSTTRDGSTTTEVAIPPGDLDIAAFPDLRSDDRYGDLQTLAQAFATQILGFDTDVVVGEFQQGDSRSGEIPIRPGGAGSQTPTTTVLVRQVSDGSWVVSGAATDSIRLDDPSPLVTLSSPQDLVGAATAFEGHVDVALYADGESAPIATTFVTGGGGGELGPFSSELEFDAPPGATHGLLVLSSAGGEDGTTWAATAIRVRF